MFVGRFGIVALPFLFVVNGVFTIVGTFIYSSFIDKIPKEKIILMTVLLSAVFLLAAALLGHTNEMLFFACLLAAEAIFLVQLKIVTNGFVETLFTPLESERTFPIIESAETIGGIIAGVLVTTFSGVINPSQFIYLWIIALLFILPCLLYYKLILKGVYKFHLDGGEEEGAHGNFGLIDKMKEVVSQVKHVAFIKGLFFVVMLQWIFANLIEFQYTKAVSQNVSEAVLTSGSGFEHALVHDLGALFILFSVMALVIQLFVGSRLITSLGIIGSMLLYPIVMLLSIFGMTIRFNFSTAVLAQTNKHITHAIHMNSYHSAYYSIKEHFREHTREFLEGIVRPVGAIIGTLLLIGLQRLFIGEDLTLSVNLVMMVVLLLLLFVTYESQGRYTKLACHNLQRAEDKLDKIGAIDILSQRGHKTALPILRKTLHDPKESPYIKTKVLHALGELQEFDALDDIIESFKSKKTEIRLAAVEALLKFHSVKNFFFKHMFHEHKMIEALKTLYKHEKNHEIRSIIIHLLSKLSPVGTFGFLLDVLKKSKGDLKADAILALGVYKDDHVTPYVEPFFHSKRPEERAAAAISLWRHPNYRDEAELILDKMLTHKSSKEVACALHSIGELRWKSKQKKCKKFLNSDNKNIKIQAAIALAKMGYMDSVEVIVELLFDENKAVVEETRKALKKLPHKVGKAVEREVKQVVAARINALLVKTKAKSLKHLDTKYLKNLKMLYSLVEENEEVELINELLYARRYS
jgi:HEAT repeat protein